MMDHRIFLSSQVARIVRISGRQVLSWTEKGVVEPYQDSTGTGVRREYDYINLLEFGVCKALFSMGFSFRSVKTMVAKLRANNTISSWAEDFRVYSQKVMEDQRKAFDKFFLGMKDDPNLVGKFREFYDRFLTQTYTPGKPSGILIYFWGENENDLEAKIYPWEFDYIMNFNDIKETLTDYKSSVIIDIGRIKDEIDQGL